MALPSLSKSGVTTMTFSRGDAYPRPQLGDDGQLIGESEAGTIRIATLRAPVEFITLNFAGQTRIPTADYVALKAFLQDPLINFRANTFTFTDVDASTATVRYFEGFYGFSLTSSGLYQGTLVLRKELA